jgi:hypothetical protein
VVEKENLALVEALARIDAIIDEFLRRDYEETPLLVGLFFSKLYILKKLLRPLPCEAVESLSAEDEKLLVAALEVVKIGELVLS